MEQRRSSRRELLAGLSFAGASLVLPGRAAVAAEPVAVEPVSGDAERLIAYFHEHARELLRPAVGVLRYPSISPSLPRATYSSSLWDWDTLWTARGLLRLAALTRDARLKQDVCEHLRGSVANFFDHQAADGRIPMLITVHDADPLGCLRGDKPHKENQAKPVMAQMARLVVEACGDAMWFAPYMPKLAAFYESWRENNLSATGLLVWGDDVAIGNDNDPTTYGRPFFSSANLLLNCLYHEDLRAAAELAGTLGRQDERARYEAQRAQVTAAIQKHCWDERDRFFYTADVQCVDRRAELLPGLPRGMAMTWDSLPLRIQTFTGFLPMWCGITTAAQNRALLEHLGDQSGLGARFGVRTLSAKEPMYSLVASSNPSNWLGPVWIIVNYLVWSGLVRNGFSREAKRIAASTVGMLARDLERSGSLNEYYHPDTGEPLSHAGFMDWNLLVLEMLDA